MSDPSLTIDLAHLAVEAVPTFVVAVFLWAGRRFVADQKEGVARLEKALAELSEKFQRSSEEKHGDDITLRMLSEGLARVEKETQLNRDRYHELSQVVTFLRGRLDLRSPKKGKTGEHPMVRLVEEDD